MAPAIRPVLLVADKNVTVKYSDAKSDYMGVCQTDGGKFSFDIIIFQETTRRCYEKSWLHKRISLDELLCGVLLHEVSHVKYDSFKRPDMANVHQGVWAYIDNVLEDSRIEYRLTYDHPSYARYLRWLLVALRTELMAEQKDQQKNAELKKLTEYLRQLFMVTRFGIIEDNYDEKFISFALPLVVSSMRGDRDNVIQAINAIYDYLSGEVDMNKIPQTKIVYCVVSAEELKDILEKLGDKVVSSGISIVIEEQKTGGQQAGNQNLPAYGKLAGSGEHELVLEDKDNGFYRSVIENYGDVIEGLRSVFKRVFESVRFVKDYDGEINVKRQQSAYLNSLTNDTALDYIRMERKDNSLDVVLIRDVSGSTSGVMEEYASSLVCFLAALEGLHNVKTGAVDFSEKHHVAKTFKEEGRQSRIYPTCNGGTSLSSSIDEIAKWDWRASKRLAFVITDGEIFDYNLAKQKMDVLQSSKNIHFFMLDVAGGDIDGEIDETALIHCGIRQLPDVLARLVLRRFIS